MADTSVQVKGDRRLATPEEHEEEEDEEAAEEDILYEVETFFAAENLKINTALKEKNEIISNAIKSYPKLKKDKIKLRKAFSDKPKLEAALEELAHQIDLLKILQEVYRTSSEELNEFLDGALSGLEIIYRFLSNSYERQSIVRAAIQRAITNKEKKVFYLQLILYKNDWKAYFGFAMQYSALIKWDKWIKVGKVCSINNNHDQMGDDGAVTEEKQVPVHDIIKEKTSKSSHITALCQKVKEKWDAISDEGELPDLYGKNNIPRWVLMSLFSPATPCKEAVHAYFKLIEGGSNGRVKLLNPHWSTERFFAANNKGTIFPSLKSFDLTFAIISPNPYGVSHFVLYVMEPKKKTAFFYDPLGISGEAPIRDNRAIKRAIEYVNSHIRECGQAVKACAVNTGDGDGSKRSIGPKTACIGLSGIFISQFAKEISMGISSLSYYEDIHQRIELMHAELLEGGLYFPKK